MQNLTQHPFYVKADAKAAEYKNKTLIWSYRTATNEIVSERVFIKQAFYVPVDGIEMLQDGIRKAAGLAPQPCKREWVLDVVNEYGESAGRIHTSVDSWTWA